ncbi:MAG: hypothetical protein AVDCRST_MAG68-2245 [uncultured Gemmatimonadetes bacterium]|uniref:Type 4 fimbrial biogenesis protein PilX N-terminal domain-containing protein n=1 Tax=uncultured Gemmatimonadota bacterium TaxID=203437 RepID=A0A6J4LBV3_9BACT|nr:MAG: hypothetical protein AVDCRST_MAG68-2245 [uncultured Gemmatimonadota bacterium]
MRSHFRALRNEHGVALPLAMIGLVVVSILVTAALVSSSTELAVSGAHQEATRGVYSAEEGLEAYVSSLDAQVRANPLVPLASFAGTFAIPSGGDASVTLRQLYRRNPVTTPGAVVTNGRAVYCITSTPVRSGGRTSRMLGAFLQFDLTPGDLRLNVNGAGSFGEDVVVKGNSEIVGQAQNVSLCGSVGAVPAIETSKDGTLETSGSVTLEGGSRQTEEDTAQFRARILGGKTPLQVAQKANIKFGPLLGSTRTFSNNFRARSDVATKDSANWGCPDSMDGVTCTAAAADTSYYPVVGIDARGGQVDLQGEHGQGIIVVINGGLRVSGNFKYKGIIIVDGDLDVTGTLQVEGAVIGLNAIQVGRDGTNHLGGTVNITFDPCVNRRVQQAFNDDNPAFTLGRPLYGWFEVVR